MDTTAGAMVLVMDGSICMSKMSHMAQDNKSIPTHLSMSKLPSDNKEDHSIAS